MEIPPAQFANEYPARSVQPVDALGMVALRAAAPAARRRSETAELVEAFDFTGSLAFPIETFIS